MSCVRFDGTNGFELCHIEMNALLVELGLQGALEGESKLPAILSPDEKIVMSLINFDIKISNEDRALLLLSTLFASYERFVVASLYGRTSITLEDVNVVKLERVVEEGDCSLGEQQRGTYHEGQNELFKAKSPRTMNMGVAEQSDGKYDILRVAADRGIKTLTTSSRLEGGRILMASHTCDIVGVGRVRIEMYDGSEFASKRQAREQSKLLKKYGLGELVDLENAKVVSNSTCLMVGESYVEIPTKPDTSDKSKGGLDLSGTCKSRGGAREGRVCEGGDGAVEYEKMLDHVLARCEPR
ncbi:hypothetical protein CRG98_011685 [Punica granatum]|uniref:Uncharacterized protein n=1 Tax=Punica granatum TaxID=22663 RepID=A0A2I0KI09_PUNGR|nr:hypothetical protein CRG98_011685 [Punica granatum]